MSIEELYNILLSDTPSINIKENEERIFELIPELRICKGFDQNNEWHVYDVYEHILHVVDNVSNNLVLRLVALFHDIGKPLSYTVDDNGVGHFRGHWVESKKIFDMFATKYDIENRELISNLIFYHDVNLAKYSTSELDELYSILGSEGIEYLYIIKRADLLAQNKKFHGLLDDYDVQKSKIMSRFVK